MNAPTKTPDTADATPVDATPVDETPVDAPNGKSATRKRLLTILAIVVVIAIIVWAVFHFLLAAPEEETDDAYVTGDVVAITARDLAMKPSSISSSHSAISAQFSR